MAFDPVREDYLRLELRYLTAQSRVDALAQARKRSGFTLNYHSRRNSLPQTDADRAFYLVVQATDLVDYRLPYVGENEVDAGIARTGELLEEALELDEHCFDARRMKAAIDFLSFEEYYRYLTDGLAEVKEYCEAARDAVPSSSPNPQLERALAVYPYLRWANTLAGRALISGRYRIAANICLELMAFDASDVADARYTLAYALAKLEDEEGYNELEQLVHKRFPESVHNAWLVFGRAALAFRQRDYGLCEAAILDLIGHYPYAGRALIEQNEYPDALFSRMPFEPFSDNELFLALSEGTVLWQEGLEESVMGFARIDPGEYEQMHHTGTFGTWLAENPKVKAAAEANPRSPRDQLAAAVQQYKQRGSKKGGEA